MNRCFKFKYVGQISFAICWDDAEGHFGTNLVFASHESVSRILSKNTNILEHCMQFSTGMIRIQTVSDWNLIQMRMIQAVTSDISAPLPGTGLPFRRALTNTVTESANAHRQSRNTFLCPTTANSIRSISQGPAEKKKTVFSWAHLNITLHHSWYHTTVPLASANQLTSLGPCASLICWQPHSCRHGRGPPLWKIVGVEGHIRAWP